jgi:hypothetical protein
MTTQQIEQQARQQRQERAAGVLLDNTEVQNVKAIETASGWQPVENPRVTHGSITQSPPDKLYKCLQYERNGQTVSTPFRNILSWSEQSPNEMRASQNRP